jgi:hypothetical protein
MMLDIIIVNILIIAGISNGLVQANFRATK